LRSNCMERRRRSSSDIGLYWKILGD
jgi:hypothetical protein